MPRSVFTPAYAAFRDVLVAARTNAGVTQQELADGLGRSQQWVSKMESGERRLDVIELIAVCRALDLDPEEVFATIVRRTPKSLKI